MWLFSLKLSRNTSVTPHSVGHQRSYTVQMGISKVYKGSPFPMLLFAPHRLLFNRNYIFATCPLWNEIYSFSTNRIILIYSYFKPKGLQWSIHTSTDWIILIYWHYSDVIMGTMTYQITSLTIVYSAGAVQRKHQSFASLAFVQGIHRWQVNSPHKWPVTRKMLPFDDVIMIYQMTDWIIPSYS